MVYVGFGIAAALVSFLIYKQGFASFLRLLSFWCGNHDERQQSLGSPHTPKQVSEGIDGFKAGEEGLILERSAECSDASNSGIELEEPITEEKALIPSFTLDDAESNDKNYTPRSGGSSGNDRDSTSNMASGSASSTELLEQTPSMSMPPPPRPSRPLERPSQASASALMPPPSPNTSTLRPLPRLSTRRQPPPSAAASLRIPPSRSAVASPTTSAASSLSTSTLAPSKRPSKKVLLEPGYSPLDWAYLTQHPPSSTYLRGDSVPPNLIRIPPSLLRQHTGRRGKDAWGVWQGKVYNLTPYMKFHPGGVGELMKAAGREKDGERLFLETHPWVNWESMLSECLVGILVGEGEDDETPVNGGASTGISSLEAMD